MKKQFYYLICVSLILICITFMFNSCYYKPFIGYALNNKGFKSFSENEKIAGNNLNPQRDYHINKYDWSLEVFPDKKKISGQMTIHFTAGSNQTVFLFDLQKKMKINSFECSIKNAKIDRKGDFMYLLLNEETEPKTKIKLTINYEGKPANLAGNGPIIWDHDKKNRHWISSLTEGIGPHFIMPCNALLKAEADSCSINITVPNSLIAVANGQLKKVTNNKASQTKTYSYEIRNPINTYSISFSIGHFKEIIKPYTTINGQEKKIECQVLDYNYEIANTFYNQVPKVMQEFEAMYGEFPWWDDGCKFIESNFTAMEHQSGIAMGSNYSLDNTGYNPILIHELSHEWWGNNITGYDYCDIWIHEGMATYSEALFLERLFGKTAYNEKIQSLTKETINTIPIRKPCNVLYNSWINDADKDIYSKGALLMHSLRTVVKNDSLFFNSLLSIQKDFKQQNISSEELIQHFNILLKKDYSSLFNWYLDKVEPPILQVKKDKKNKQFYYKWKTELPFYKNGKIFIKNKKDTTSLTPTINYKSYPVDSFNLNDILIENSIYYKIEIQ